ncbi:MAG: DUF4239 domain-containing protein, partial [Gammaproteobacteria bacterium]|nr:DUF4239 domain-containing protein [Gammaproteobacteria bacterium]
AIFGLLIAFTVSGAANRFNDKRMLIAQEVNAIQTAYLRVQLLAQEQRPALQDLFRRYVDSRLDYYRKLSEGQAADAAMAASETLQRQIWRAAVTDSELAGAHRDAGKLLLPALNIMIDISTTRAMALQIHPPIIIYVLLFCLAAICSLLAGYRMAASEHRSWLHIFGFSLVTVVVVYAILDIEYLREGLIRLQSADQLLVKARASMN